MLSKDNQGITWPDDFDREENVTENNLVFIGDSETGEPLKAYVKDFPFSYKTEVHNLKNNIDIINEEINKINENIENNQPEISFDSKLKITDSDGVETTFGLLKLGEKIPLKLRIVSDQEDELSEVDKVQINGNVYLLVYDFHWNFLGTEGITLTSSNPSVATISDDGIIAGISDGTVTFKAVRNSDGAVGETQEIRVESLRITLSEFEDSQIPEIDVIFLDYPTYVWIWDIDGNLVDPLECELELWDRDFDMSESISPEGKITMGGWAMYGGPMTVIATRKVGGVGVGSKTVNLA